MKIQDEVIYLISQFKGEKNVILKANEDLFQLGILDSFGVIEFISLIEKQFQLQLITMI